GRGNSGVAPSPPRRVAASICTSCCLLPKVHLGVDGGIVLRQVQGPAVGARHGRAEGQAQPVAAGIRLTRRGETRKGFHEPIHVQPRRGRKVVGNLQPCTVHV